MTIGKSIRKTGLYANFVKIPRSQWHLQPVHDQDSDMEPPIT